MFGELGSKFRSSSVVAAGSRYPALYTSGGNLYHRHHPVHPGAATVNIRDGYLYAAPWPVPQDIYLTDVGIEIKTQTALAVIRIGLYSDYKGYPLTLIQEFGNNCANASISCNVAPGTLMYGGLTNPLYVRSGFYWITYVAQGAAVPCNGMNYGLLHNLALGSVPATGAPAFAYTQNPVAGALPANFTRTVYGIDDPLARIVFRIL